MIFSENRFPLFRIMLRSPAAFDRHEPVRRMNGAWPARKDRLNGLI
jgi:hypothetical protein